MTLACHTTTGTPPLRYDRNITAPFREDDNLFILDHFPLSTPVYAYDFLDTTVGVATILLVSCFIVDTTSSASLGHPVLATLVLRFTHLRSTRRTIGSYCNATKCFRADSVDDWSV